MRRLRSRPARHPIVIQPDGRIVVGGTADPDVSPGGLGAVDFALARYLGAEVTPGPGPGPIPDPGPVSRYRTTVRVQDARGAASLANGFVSVGRDGDHERHARLIGRAGFPAWYRPGIGLRPPGGLIRSGG